MRCALSLSLLSLLWGCSDDTTASRDIGTKADQTVSGSEKGAGDLARVDVPKGADGTLPCQTTKKVAELAPQPGGAVGWDDDAAKWAPDTGGPHAAYTDTDIENLPIDGHNAPFQGKNDGFVMEYYKKGTSKLEFHLWQMKSAQLAADVYSSLKSTDETTNKITYADVPNAPEKSSIGSAGNYWKVLGYKCNYYYEISKACVEVGPNVCDKTQLDALKPDVIAFVQYFVKLLP